ncbi:MAG: phytanoyl-CoA dioxygenase family protein [Fimbriimonadaceae bacterium]
MTSPEMVEFYQEHGYALAQSLFDSDEVCALRDHFMDLRAKGSYPGDTEGVNASPNDPLRKFPRMIHMHRWDPKSLDWMTDPRINEVITALSGGVEPFAVQTMLYFKPPGARGQALHQDQYYLRAVPGTCVAAWLALDDCDEENGCMMVVPGSHRWPLLCTTEADTTQSFTDVTVPLPPGERAEPCVMKAGDVLFFHGLLVHGSFPNVSTDRFRRALIGHYLTGDAKQVGSWYEPVYKMDGTIVEFETTPEMMPCGVWAEGKFVVEERKLVEAHE